MRTRVKICGITRPEDALAAAKAGADAIGLVFYPPSPRAVSITQAAEIVRRLPPFVSTVGLFVDALPESINEVLQALPLDLLQFHGDEPPEACGRYGRPYIKAVRMRPDLDLAAMEQRYHQAAGLLLDSYQPGQPGGTGETFDWERIPDSMRRRIILAGGLSPENVASAIARIHPYAVDVSGGVERGKGIKDEARISAFMRGVESVKRQDD